MSSTETANIVMPAPSFTTTYKRADGDPIDDHGWVTETDWFEDLDEPVQLIEERWERVEVRRVWKCPPLFACHAGLYQDDDCDDDAVVWGRRADDVLLAVCDAHRSMLVETFDG